MLHDLIYRAPLRDCRCSRLASLVISTAFVLVLLGSFGGCSERSMPRTETFPVTGSLTYEGEPMAGAMLAFFPAADQSATSHGVSDESGNYTLSTHLTGDGAPAGQYIVTIYWPDRRGLKSTSPEEEDSPEQTLPNRLPKAYSRAKTSALRATVEAGPNQIDFALPMEP